jgi:hypothetical protein
MDREFEFNSTPVVIHEFGQIKANKVNKIFKFNLNFESIISATPNIMLQPNYQRPFHNSRI